MYEYGEATGKRQFRVPFDCIMLCIIDCIILYIILCILFTLETL